MGSLPPKLTPSEPTIRFTTRHVLVSGQVQGVSYRYSMATMANHLGLRGWCRNLPDGRVEAVIQGPQDDVRTLIQWCHIGPPEADVKQVEEQPVPPQQEQRFADFSIRR